MKARNLYLILFFIGFTASCSSIYGVKYDYDLQTNFAEFKTYDWMQIPEKADIDSLVVQRVKNAVNAELKTKGLMLSSNNPDFLIAEYLAKINKVRVTDWGYGYRPYGRYGRYSGRSTSYSQYEKGVLILDFVDTKSMKMIWRGSANAEVQDINTPEKSEELINSAVKEILKRYPPPLSK